MSGRDSQPTAQANEHVSYAGRVAVLMIDSCGSLDEMMPNDRAVMDLARAADDEIERLRTAAYQACSEMGCYCADDDPQPDNLKCPMCKLEKALHGEPVSALDQVR